MICVIHFALVENKSHIYELPQQKRSVFSLWANRYIHDNREACLIHITNCPCINENKIKSINSTQAKWQAVDSCNN